MNLYSKRKDSRISWSNEEIPKDLHKSTGDVLLSKPSSHLPDELILSAFKDDLDILSQNEHNETVSNILYENGFESIIDIVRNYKQVNDILSKVENMRNSVSRFDSVQYLLTLRYNLYVWDTLCWSEIKHETLPKEFTDVKLTNNNRVLFDHKTNIPEHITIITDYDSESNNYSFYPLKKIGMQGHINCSRYKTNFHKSFYSKDNDNMKLEPGDMINVSKKKVELGMSPSSSVKVNVDIKIKLEAQLLYSHKSKYCEYHVDDLLLAKSFVGRSLSESSLINASKTDKILSTVLKYGRPVSFNNLNLYKLQKSLVNFSTNVISNDIISKDVDILECFKTSHTKSPAKHMFVPSNHNNNANYSASNKSHHAHFVISNSTEDSILSTNMTQENVSEYQYCDTKHHYSNSSSCDSERQTHDLERQTHDSERQTHDSERQTHDSTSEEKTSRVKRITKQQILEFKNLVMKEFPNLNKNALKFNDIFKNKNVIEFSHKHNLNLHQLKRQYDKFYS